MTDLDKTLEKVAALYEQLVEPTAQVTLVQHARTLTFFARDYISAASILEREGPHHLLPMLQLTGHAVELALKACLASANAIPPRDHDLVELCRQAQELGFELEPPMFAAIVHLRHLYFQDLATGTRHKARYPTARTERLGGVVPGNSTFTAIVGRLLDQAAKRGTALERVETA